MFDIRTIRIPNVVLANECEDEFRRVLTALWNKYQPLDILEANAVIAYACYNWRWRRLWEIETAAVNAELADATGPESLRVKDAFDRAIAKSPFVASIAVHETRLRRATREAEHKLERLLKAREAAEMAPPTNEIRKNEPTGPANSPIEIRKNEPAVAQIPRNALCPCRSGQKYKRCCGRLAPPILGPMAA